MSENIVYDIEHIDIDLLQTNVSFNNIRSSFDDEAIIELANSIKSDGLINPLLIMDTEDEEGRACTQVLCGERRLRAIKHIQVNMDPDFMCDGVPSIYFEGTLDEARIIQVAENIDRTDLNEADIAKWLYEQVSDGGHTQSELAEKLGRPLNWVNFRILVHKRASDLVKEALADGFINFSVAYQVSKDFSKEDQDKFISDYKKQGQSPTLRATKAATNNKSVKPTQGRRVWLLQSLCELQEQDPKDEYESAIHILKWVEGIVSSEEIEEWIETLKEE